MNWKRWLSATVFFQNTERLKIFQFRPTLSCTVAELDHNGLLVNLQYKPKNLLRNLNLFILALLGSWLTFSYILVSAGTWSSNSDEVSEAASDQFSA